MKVAMNILILDVVFMMFVLLVCCLIFLWCMGRGSVVEPGVLLGAGDRVMQRSCPVVRAEQRVLRERPNIF